MVVLVVGGLLYFGWQVLRWTNEEFVVTSRRVLQSEGVVNKRVVDSSLEKINDAVLSQSIFGRMFGFGDLDILTASESGISRLRMLRQPATSSGRCSTRSTSSRSSCRAPRPLPRRPAIRARPAPVHPPTAAGRGSRRPPAAGPMSRRRRHPDAGQPRRPPRPRRDQRRRVRGQESRAAPPPVGSLPSPTARPGPEGSPSCSSSLIRSRPSP